MKIWLFHAPNQARENNTPCLVSLKEAVLAKDGKLYKYIQGPVSTGYIGISSSINIAIRIGNENTHNHFVILMDNVLSIQECNKVIKRDDILILT